jgi:dienelactone hydrolase
MWNSFRTDDRAGITAEVITYPGGSGDEIHAYLARLTSKEPTPGVVAVHHLPGFPSCRPPRLFEHCIVARLCDHGDHAMAN